MRMREMTRLMSATARLTPVQRAIVLLHFQLKDEGDQLARVIRQRRPAKPVCPKCSAARVVRNGQDHGLQRYKCRACSVTFNALTGTPLARLRYRERWLDQCQALLDGVSVRKAATRLDVHRTTAFRWRNRFLQCPREIKGLAMCGVVAADETCVLGSFKVQRKLLAGSQRASRRGGGKALMCGLSREQIPVLVLRARTGQTADFVLRGAPNKAVVRAVVPRAVAADAACCVPMAAACWPAPPERRTSISRRTARRGSRGEEAAPRSWRQVAHILCALITWSHHEHHTVSG
jgi:transposase-like protein